MVLSAIFPKGYSLVILFSTINPPFIVPYLSIGKLLIFSERFIVDISENIQISIVIFSSYFYSSALINRTSFFEF